MIYAKRQNDEGSYEDADGVRYDVLSVRRLRSPEGVNQGWQEFASLNMALIVWGLKKVSAIEISQEK